MTPGETYDIQFMYDTRSSMPKDALLFFVNGEMIPTIETTETVRLSDEFRDGDNDGLVDKLDKSASDYIVMDPT